MSETSSYDWRSKLCKKKEEREASCFISPQGDWYNIPFAEHWEFTRTVLEEVYHQTYGGKVFFEPGGKRKVEQELYERNWIWVHDDPFSGTIVQGRINAKQHKALKEFFGDTRLFRGWTIDMLYHEQRE